MKTETILQKLSNRTPVADYIFYAYLVFLVSYLLSMPQRISILGVIRFDFLVALFLIGMLILNSQSSKLVYRLPVARAIFVLFAYIIVTVPIVEWPGSVVKNNLIPYIKAVVFFFFTASFVDTGKRLKIFTYAYLACQTFRVLEPLYLNITTGYWGSATYLGGGQTASRLSGAPTDVINPNGLGFVICIAWTFCHYLLGNLGKTTSKLLYWGLIPLFAYAMVLTMSRSGFVALLVILFIFFIQSNKKFLLILIGGIGVTVAVANMTDVQKQRYLSLSGQEGVQGSESSAGRFRFMGRMAETWMNRPIIGHGLGTSAEAGANYGTDAKIAHSLYLEVLIELGVIGFIFYIVFLRRVYDALKQMQKRIQEIKKHLTKKELEAISFEYELSRAIVTCFWMFLVFSIAYFGFSRSWWYVLAGLTVALYIQASTKALAFENKTNETSDKLT